MWPNLQETPDLVTITEEILNGKLHFLCSDTKTLYRLHYMWTGLSEKNQDLVYTLTEMISEPYQSYTIELFSKWLTALSRCFSKKLNLRCLTVVKYISEQQPSRTSNPQRYGQEKFWCHIKAISMNRMNQNSGKKTNEQFLEGYVRWTGKQKDSQTNERAKVSLGLKIRILLSSGKRSPLNFATNIKQISANK